MAYDTIERDDLAMIQRRWMLPMAVAVLAAAAGCSSDGAADDGPPGPDTTHDLPQAPGPTAAGPVENVEARCGVQGVFWGGTWWIVDPPISKVRNETVTSTISGTMTPIGNNQARLDSPGLETPQILSMEAGRNESTPPFQECTPIAP